MQNGLGAKINVKINVNKCQQKLGVKTNLRGCENKLVFKAHGLLYHSTLGLRVFKKKKKDEPGRAWRSQGYSPRAAGTQHPPKIGQ